MWNGLLIGAGIGAGGGYLWARNICGSNDPECFAITKPVGVLGGAGIGAAVGALLDALQNSKAHAATSDRNFVSTTRTATISKR